MKISDVIRELERQKKHYGDIEVVAQDLGEFDFPVKEVRVDWGLKHDRVVLAGWEL